MNNVMERLRAEKIIAIVRGVSSEQILPLARALLDGGISMMELTFDQSKPETWQDTCAGIRRLAEEFSGALLPGAGTVLTLEQLSLAREAGARYIISPDTDEGVIRETKKLGLCSFPGAFTPTEVVRAWKAGADAVKLFPASNLGAEYVKALRAPLSHIPLLAVGGVTAENAGEFIACGCAGVGVGGGLANKKWIAEGAFDKITALAREYGKAVGR